MRKGCIYKRSFIKKDDLANEAYKYTGGTFHRDIVPLEKVRSIPIIIIMKISFLYEWLFYSGSWPRENFLGINEQMKALSLIEEWNSEIIFSYKER